MEFTLQEVQEKEIRLTEIEASLSDARQAYQEAGAFGDRSENSELDAVKQTINQLISEKQVLETELSDYTIIRPSKGPRIVIGDYINVQKVSDRGEPVGDIRTLRIASQGDTIHKETLGVESPLGKLILNGTDGIYTVQAPGGVVKYNVKKANR